ncbi:helix-turn-helix domain-containing protein [Streptococcus mitis]|uniref:Helix-turn-helix domain-containing protein n=1 Tax=Streptococcus mitis TaxID=28037 RepID=A0A6L5H3V5_STRMT|nr:S24 family peptidase [Streptococcus mitis]MQP59873.1 helix-turn-helix domain-containing protein [Streptococcus mitis]MQP69369.1 helix-turn-helix domain-containing protein [Streptococcus mitis]MQP72159.1 helix-turn-helix domain-containing protein [Streptococcus mitis]MQP73899.1 helix-turn-helix domain-containing protein [Streptococcus mitis]MQP87423.1 helix-turn-helix domain-containing protein [Streptococcus mitis]
MDKEQIAIVIGEKIKQYRLANGWTQQELGAKIGISKNAIGNYEKGFRSPKKNTMFDLANAFNVSIDDLFPPIQKDTPPPTSPIQSIYDQLEPPRQGKVLTFAEKQLKEQKNEEETKINEVSENIIRLDDYRQTTYRRVTWVVSAGSGSMQDDDLDMEVSFYEDEIPDDYDAIAYVVGNSMEPKIKNGDYLFIKNTPQVDFNTIGIFQVDGANYVKKLRQGYLESLNPDYEDIHLDESNDIRTIGEVVSVYREK